MRKPICGGLVRRPLARWLRVLLVPLPLLACRNNNAVGPEFPPELVEFVEYEGNPVFTSTETDTWDKRFRERGFILKEGDTWHLWMRYPGLRYR